MDAKVKVGAPAAYKSKEELQDAIEEYLNNPQTRKVIAKDGSEVQMPLITITGLALHLGFASRQSFYDYEAKEEFTYTIKRARMFIEHEYEAQLQCGNTVGAIFALKNMGWSDRLTQEISGPGGTGLFPEMIKVIHE